MALTINAEAISSYRARNYCTLAVTDAFAFSVNVHVRVFSLPLEHAPDQIASRPLLMLNVIDVPVVNDADPVLPTDTLMPDGLDRTRSPDRPVAVTVSVAVPPPEAGVTVSGAVLVTPPCVPLSVTAVDAVTVLDTTVNVALRDPAAMVTDAGTVAAVLLLESVTVAPPAGALAVNVAVPTAFALPPTTVVGLTDKDESVGVDGAASTVKVRDADQLPAVPEELRPRTRHQY